MDEEGEEGGLTSKTTLSGEHGCQSKAKRRVQWERADSPGPSCVSMKSDHSMDPPVTFKDGIRSIEKRVQKERADSPGPSCVSMKSDHSMDPPVTFKDGNRSIEKRKHQEKSNVTSARSEQQETELIKMAEEIAHAFLDKELKKLWTVLFLHSPQCSESQREVEEVGKNEEQRRRAIEGVVDITKLCLMEMNQDILADTLWGEAIAVECQHKLKSHLMKKFRCVFEGIPKAGQPTGLNDFYTEIYITERGSGEVNKEHEVRLIERFSRRPAKKETPIKCEDIFKPLPGRDQPIRTILTTGVAGIGKTVLTHKFTLDWAEGNANHDIQFTFTFTFRELNLLKGKEFSMVELLHHFFIGTKEAGICRNDRFQVVLILDGLDECRLPLDFQNNQILTDVTESTSVDVLLTNLIRGYLLPSARIWITTRPAAANQIPAEYVGMVTEVRGFTDHQKEDYFRKRFREEAQASTIISHVKISRSLHIMCHIPVFCWITATVLEDFFETSQRGEVMPNTVTRMYIYFLRVLSIQGDRKYHGRAETDPHWSSESREIIVSLGKLAFNQLEKGNLIFYEADLAECGIDINAASVYSGVFTQIFKEECGLYQDKVFCFVHLSIQEFLAALYVFLPFMDTGDNPLSEEQSATGEDKLLLLYQKAVDMALQSENGHLDLFLRFLLGLSLETNQILLRGLLGQTRSRSLTIEGIVSYIKEKLNGELSPERSINLFHCLNELNDHSLVKNIQHCLKSGSLSKESLSPAQWSALVFILLSSEEKLDVFDLKKYSASAEGLLRLLPVVKASKTSLMNGCHLSERCCKALASVLSSNSSSLRKLDLSTNDLQDSGVKLLSAGLGSPHCTLKTLKLNGCHLSERSCEALASVLSSNSSSLRELDLSNNDLQDSGVKLLSAGLGSPHCTLETLRLSGCLITQEGCASLASALSSNPSHLRELDLSYNHPGDSGAALLSAGLKDPRWRLDTLSVEHGGARRLKPALKKYACKLTMDPNTANKRLTLSKDNTKVTEVEEKQSYADHPEELDSSSQVLCREVLTGRCYWEVEWKGEVSFGVTYRENTRRGGSVDSRLGRNSKSWSLEFHGDRASAKCSDKNRDIPTPSCHDDADGDYGADFGDDNGDGADFGDDNGDVVDLGDGADFGDDNGDGADFGDDNGDGADFGDDNGDVVDLGDGADFGDDNGDVDLGDDNGDVVDLADDNGDVVGLGDGADFGDDNGDVVDLGDDNGDVVGLGDDNGDVVDLSDYNGDVVGLGDGADFGDDYQDLVDLGDGDDFYDDYQDLVDLGDGDDFYDDYQDLVDLGDGDDFYDDYQDLVDLGDGDDCYDDYQDLVDLGDGDDFYDDYQDLVDLGDGDDFYDDYQDLVDIGDVDDLYDDYQVLVDTGGDYYIAWYYSRPTVIRLTPSDDISSAQHNLSSGSNRVGVYLDRLAGTLSFYRVSSDTLTHIHTFQCTFTQEDLLPGFDFELRGSGSTVSLCRL
ncbi:NACHT, LRR and PYD domains-containing protein 12-like isoform X2 [Gadus chalcogrammus]|uniref:NACHT, LRR and PYD domains-containing protein 12-like isoform X2 n=1 Tax=Gadus chalcogrammus TaxID=1042646 RepID=UPI0024C49462|nr:NACHT, LRR and PYD domains-containing protein 12-like isoform X2 [Gadus chalcogrammus]